MAFNNYEYSDLEIRAGSNYIMQRLAQKPKLRQQFALIPLSYLQRDEEQFTETLGNVILDNHEQIRKVLTSEKKDDIFRIGGVVNVGHHYVCAAIIFKPNSNPEVYILDSLQDADTTGYSAELIAENASRQQNLIATLTATLEPYFVNDEINAGLTDEQKIKAFKVSWHKLSQQRNGVDCGPIALSTLECFANGCGYEVPIKNNKTNDNDKASPAAQKEANWKKCEQKVQEIRVRQRNDFIKLKQIEGPGGIIIEDNYDFDANVKVEEERNIMQRCLAALKQDPQSKYLIEQLNDIKGQRVNNNDTLTSLDCLAFHPQTRQMPAASKKQETYDAAFALCLHKLYNSQCIQQDPAVEAEAVAKLWQQLAPTPKLSDDKQRVVGYEDSDTLKEVTASAPFKRLASK